MSKKMVRLVVLGGLITGLSCLPGCGGSDDAVVLEEVEMPTAAQREREMEESMKKQEKLDPRELMNSGK